MFNSLRTRLWLTYALLSAVILGVLGLALVVYLARNPLAEQRLRLAAQTIVQRIDVNTTRQDAAGLREALLRVDDAFDVRVVVISPDGRLVLDSRANRASPLTLSPLLGSDRTAGSVRDGDNLIWRYQVRPVGGGFRVVVATPQLRPLVALAATIREGLLRPFIVAWSVALVLALLLAILMTRWVSAPLRRMEMAARAVAAGDYAALSPEGPREVQALARSFNEMTQRVQAGQQSQRDFVANVSHELRTPLTSIQGFSQAILDGAVSSPEALQQAASVIQSEAGRMHRLVLDLLDLARLDAGTVEFARQPVDLANLLHRVGEKFIPQAQEARVDLVVEVDGLSRIVGDGDRLAQVFTNLIDNAIKFTPAGGKVSVQARQQDQNIEVSISDTGSGIPPEELSRIFERFYQLDKSRPGGTGRGAGLGLAIAHEIIAAHHGQLSAHSKPGQGSVFMVKLPIVRPDDPTLSLPR